MSTRLRSVLWLAAVMARPVGLIVVDLWYPSINPYPPPWPANTPPQRWADGLLVSQIYVSLIAAPMVFWVTRSWPLRLLAWLGEITLLCLMAAFAFVVVMSKTGMYF